MGSTRDVSLSEINASFCVCKPWWPPSRPFKQRLGKEHDRRLDGSRASIRTPMFLLDSSSALSSDLTYDKHRLGERLSFCRALVVLSSTQKGPSEVSRASHGVDLERSVAPSISRRHVFAKSTTNQLR